MPSKRKNVYCAALNCDSSTVNNRKIGFFRFPKELEKAKLWMSQVDREDLVDRKYNNHRVCSLHFKESDISRNEQRVRLRPYAIPFSINDYESTVKTEEFEFLANELNDFESTLDSADSSTEIKPLIETIRPRETIQPIETMYIKQEIMVDDDYIFETFNEEINDNSMSNTVPIEIEFQSSEGCNIPPKCKEHKNTEECKSIKLQKFQPSEICNISRSRMDEWNVTISDENSKSNLCNDMQVPFCDNKNQESECSCGKRVARLENNQNRLEEKLDHLINLVKDIPRQIHKQIISNTQRKFEQS